MSKLWNYLPAVECSERVRMPLSVLEKAANAKLISYVVDKQGSIAYRMDLNMDKLAVLYRNNNGRLTIKDPKIAVCNEHGVDIYSSGDSYCFIRDGKDRRLIFETIDEAKKHIRDVESRKIKVVLKVPDNLLQLLYTTVSKQRDLKSVAEAIGDVIKRRSK